jgi:two-component system sensor histidine kinase/response regulator
MITKTSAPQVPADLDTEALLTREMGNPHKRLHVVFFLIGAIPVLALAYVLRATISEGHRAVAETIPVFFFAGLIMVLGYSIGYTLVRRIFKKMLAYAAHAKRADELKSSFALGLAHDLKSPLLVIKANISNLKAGFLGALTPKQEETVNTCKDVADRMNALLMDLIETYKIEARMAELTLSRFDLREAIKEQIRECEAIAGEKKIALIGKLGPQEIPFQGDHAMILRAIHNLLSNAIKYTPKGGQITVKTSLEQGFARLDFLNDGATIPAEKLEKIFDKFERLDNSAQGEGLGLAITKDIVELHKGRIWATSAPWQPNCFTILLALAPGN